MVKIMTCIIAVILIFILILSAYWWHKKFPLTDHEDTLFIMYPSDGYWFIAIAGLALFTIFMVLSLIFLENVWIYAFLVFYLFTLASIYLLICILLLKYVIKRDSLVFYTPLLPMKEVKLYEITSVKFTENGNGKKMVVGYNQKKKKFSIEESMKGFGLLYDYFDQNRKIECTPVIENFSITEEKGDMIRAVIALACFSLFSAMMVLVRDELELFYQIVILSLTLLYLLQTIHVFLWKVTVDFHSISVRNSLGFVKSYEIRQITKVLERENHIIIYIGENKTAKITKKGENFPYLMERLQRSGIQIIQSH